MVPFWYWHEIHDMKLVQEVEFEVPCWSLGQMKFTRAFWDILRAKWSPHGEESNEKRIKSKSWKWNGWKVRVVTWNSRPGIRLTRYWAYFCAYMGILANSKIDGLLGKIDVWPFKQGWRGVKMWQLAQSRFQICIEMIDLWCLDQVICHT